MLSEKELNQMRKDLEIIFQDPKTRKMWIEKFKEVCHDNMEDILPTGDNYIFNTFWTQGYWAGIKYRILWTKEKGFHVELRNFGK